MTFMLFIYSDKTIISCCIHFTSQWCVLTLFQHYTLLLRCSTWWWKMRVGDNVSIPSKDKFMWEDLLYASFLQHSYNFRLYEILLTMVSEKSYKYKLGFCISCHIVTVYFEVHADLWNQFVRYISFKQNNLPLNNLAYNFNFTELNVKPTHHIMCIFLSHLDHVFEWHILL